MEPLVFCDCLVALWLLLTLGTGMGREDEDCSGW